MRSRESFEERLLLNHVKGLLLTRFSVIVCFRRNLFHVTSSPELLKSQLQMFGYHAHDEYELSNRNHDFHQVVVNSCRNYDDKKVSSRGKKYTIFHTEPAYIICIISLFMNSERRARLRIHNVNLDCYFLRSAIYSHS